MHRSVTPIAALWTTPASRSARGGWVAPTAFAVGMSARGRTSPPLLRRPCPHPGPKPWPCVMLRWSRVLSLW